MHLHHELITPNLRTTSRVVAEKFGKRHDNVLRDVAKIIGGAPDKFGCLNFEETLYLDRFNWKQTQFEMTRDGFVPLAMGFTGAAAMEWKVRFIQAFHLMEAELAANSHRPVGQGAAMAPLPADIAVLSIMEKTSICREIRLMAGDAAALEKWNWMMPAALKVQDPDDAPAFSIEDGRACLRHILGFDIGQGSVAQALAGRDGLSAELVRPLGLGLRWDSHLFVGQNHDPRLFLGTPWTDGRNHSALMTVPGAYQSPERRRPGVIVPLAGITGTVIPLNREE